MSPRPQAVFSVWNLLAFTTAPLEQAALAYVPAAASRGEHRSTLQLLLALSVAIGCGCGLLAAGVPLLTPQLLTRDAAVWPCMARVAPLALLAMVLTAADVGATGVLLAKRDLAYVARAYALTLAVLAVFVSTCVRGPDGLGLVGVWAGLVLFFGMRCVQSVGRLLWLSRSGGDAAWRQWQQPPVAPAVAPDVPLPLPQAS
jgi:Na+-driven multidrug efflux pump